MDAFRNATAESGTDNPRAKISVAEFEAAKKEIYQKFASNYSKYLTEFSPNYNRETAQRVELVSKALEEFTYERYLSVSKGINFNQKDNWDGTAMIPTADFNLTQKAFIAFSLFYSLRIWGEENQDLAPFVCTKRIQLSGDAPMSYMPNFLNVFLGEPNIIKPYSDPLSEEGKCYIAIPVVFRSNDDYMKRFNTILHEVAHTIGIIRGTGNVFGETAAALAQSNFGLPVRQKSARNDWYFGARQANIFNSKEAMKSEYTEFLITQILFYDLVDDKKALMDFVRTVDLKKHGDFFSDVDGAFNGLFIIISDDLASNLRNFISSLKSWPRNAELRDFLVGELERYERVVKSSWKVKKCEDGTTSTYQDPVGAPEKAVETLRKNLLDKLKELYKGKKLVLPKGLGMNSIDSPEMGLA